METTNYDLFKVLPGNREINKTNVDQIVKSISVSGYVGTPIIVNSNFEVLDGQHRLEALKKLNLPVPYEFRDFGLTTVQRINSASKRWSALDHVKSQASLGNEEYIKLVDYYNKTSVPVTCIVSALSKYYLVLSLSTDNRGSRMRKNSLTQGDFVCYNNSFIDFYLNHFPTLEMVTKKPRNGNLFLALANVYRFVDIDLDEFIEKLVSYRHLFSNGFPTASLWLKAFQDCWNTGRQGKNKVNFFKRTIDRCEKENELIDEAIAIRTNLVDETTT